MAARCCSPQSSAPWPTERDRPSPASYASCVLNGRLDLPQAEAVADLVEAVTPLQARAAMDQLEGTLTAVIARIDASLSISVRASRRRSIFQTKDSTSSRVKTLRESSRDP